MTVEWHGDEFVRSVLRPAIRDGLAAAGATLNTEMRTNLNTNASPSAPMGFPGKDTGTAGRSIAHEVVSDTTVRVGTNLKYLAALESGFRATGNMTVPLSPEAKRMRRRHASLRERNDLHFVKTKRAAFLVRKVGGRNARTEFLFMLTKSIVVQPRPWARRSMVMASDKIAEAFFTTTRRSAATRATEVRA